MKNVHVTHCYPGSTFRTSKPPAGIHAVGVLLALVSFLVQPPSAIGADRAIHSDVPVKIDPSARYLFYLHNRAVEVQGRNAKTPWGEYRYDDILGALADRGFVVISEARPATTQIGPYAAKIASQVNQLLAAGVPPGASR